MRACVARALPISPSARTASRRTSGYSSPRPSTRSSSASVRPFSAPTAPPRTHSPCRACKRRVQGRPAEARLESAEGILLPAPSALGPIVDGRCATRRPGVDTVFVTPNRLAEATSPYLLQHADNPVDWFPWGEEALGRARSEGRPILLSVGYAACHWCHVMEHESFEDNETAAFMNEHFVCVKVDREERPDVDAIYMDAVQAMTGQGGWPMTVFLTPDGEPFYAGTYFPPEDRHGMPGFPRLLLAIAETWRERRSDAVDQGRRVAQAIAARSSPEGSVEPLS